MKEDYDNLINQFKKISGKKWIKSISNGQGSVGNTFENELNKKSDSLYFPDYDGIELKCTTRYSKYPLYLFTVAFDGPTFPEINRLIDLYGYPDKDFKDKKVIFTKLSIIKKYTVDNKYKFKLYLDRNDEKLYLEVYDLNNNLLERKSFVYLQSIYNHLMLKLQKMAVVHAYKRKTKDGEFFRYYKISIYELISFERFLDLLEEGEVLVELIARLNKSGVDKGRYRNKNLVFSINKDNIEKLFKKIYCYDADKFENSNFFIMYT